MSWFASAEEPLEDETLLSNQSLLLLLILVNHCTQGKKLNPYRQALFTFTNSKPKGVLRRLLIMPRTTDKVCAIFVTCSRTGPSSSEYPFDSLTCSGGGGSLRRRRAKRRLNKSA